MPASLEIGAFVLGAFLLILAIAGGGFKLFGAEFSRTIDNIPLRIFSGLLGLTFIVLAFVDPLRQEMLENLRPAERSSIIPTSQSSLTPDVALASPDAPPPSEGQQALTGCTLNIQHPYITIKSEPDVRSEDIILAKEGVHPVLGHKKTEFAGGQQTWFQIEDQGRKGWVEYIAFAMEKSLNCP